MYALTMPETKMVALSLKHYTFQSFERDANMKNPEKTLVTIITNRPRPQPPNHMYWKTYQVTLPAIKMIE